MASVSPYLKFPEWVSNQMEGKDESSSRNKPSLKKKLDLNTASPQELKMVNGVGDVLAERIIKYRNSLNGGFASFVELENVYGLQPEVITRISDNFRIQKPRYIQKVNLNFADREELVGIPHIDYEVAHNIIEYRTLHEGFHSLEELKSVKGFPINKFKQIELYLQLN